MKQLLPIVAIVLVALPLVAGAHPSAQSTLEMLSDAIRAHPESQPLYIQRGAAYSNDGQLELALADLLKAETLGDPVLAAFDQGVLHYRLEEYEAARGYFDVFLEYRPGHMASLEYRARVLRAAGDHAAALADFNAYFALQSQPNPGDYVSAAEMLRGLDGEGIAPALAMLDQGMERLGVIVQLQRYAIALELERGSVAGAIDRLESLEPALGASPDWKIDMGELLLRADRPDEAHRYFEAASAQLATLRRTTARQALLERLQALQPSPQSE